MSGTGAVKGITFQMVQALSDVVDLVIEGHGEAVTIEGADDVVDYEVLDGDGRPLAVRQAKSRQEPGTWGANEIAKVLRSWGEVDYATTAEFAFVTDASLSDSGRRLRDLIREMQLHPDEEVLRQAAASFRGGLQLPSLDVLRRVQILTRMGTEESVLAKVEMRILTLLSRARLATPEDASNAANALLRKLFLIGGSLDLERRTISREDVLTALGLDEAELQGELGWSQETAAAYRQAVAENSRQGGGFVFVDVVSVDAVPDVLRLSPSGEPATPQSLDTVLAEHAAALVGATGEGKSTALKYLAGLAAQRGLVPILFEAAGHTSGALQRRVRYGIEAKLERPLTAGAVQRVLAAPELLLLIDGVSEASAETRASLRSDLEQLAAQRPLQVIAAGRDLPRTIDGVGMPGSTAAYRLKGLDHPSRLELAGEHGVQAAVPMIEHRLRSAADNPLLFLMALSLSDDGLPRSRAEVYEQFIRGLVARAGVADDDVALAALGVAWAEMIARDQRSADHYSWRAALGAALDRLAEIPAWRGHTGTTETALATSRRTGLLTGPDADGKLAPLHDSFADFLAAKAIMRHEAALPARLNVGYDEAVLLLVELAGLNQAIALRFATEAPLLACRVARQRQSRGRADANNVGSLLQALAGDCELPALGLRGIRLYQDEQLTGVALTGEECQTVDAEQFRTLAACHPAIMMPADTSSLQLAVTLWAAAIDRALRPARRMFQPTPPADADQAGSLLISYLRDTGNEIERLAAAALPATIHDRVLSAIGPQGIVGYVSDPQPGQCGERHVPVHYRPSTEYNITRGQPPDGTGRLNVDTLARMMRLPPAAKARNEIRQALEVLTNYNWPTP